jgi:hypothetical protein
MDVNIQTGGGGIRITRTLSGTGAFTVGVGCYAEVEFNASSQSAAQNVAAFTTPSTNRSLSTPTVTKKYVAGDVVPTSITENIFLQNNNGTGSSLFTATVTFSRLKIVEFSNG